MANKLERKLNIENYINQLRNENIWGNSERMYQYYKKSAFDIVTINNNEMIEIKNLNIKTDFCFGYGFCGVSDLEESKAANNMASYARTNENYFINKNLEKIDSLISYVKESKIIIIFNHYYGGKENSLIKNYRCYKDQYNLEYDNPKNTLGNYRIATSEEKEKILNCLEEQREDFKKRLNSYLKRYGLSKIHSWSYLVD